jgi:hypothetical protein
METTPRRRRQINEDAGTDPAVESASVRRRRDLTDQQPQDGAAASRRNTAPAKAQRDDARASGRGGWGGMNTTLAEGGAFARSLKITDEPVVVKFLDDEPFDSFRSHWIEKTGRKSYRHLTGVCPLCDPFGDQPQATSVCFNVISFADPENPKLEYIEAGSRLSRKLENLSEDKRFDGLSDPRLYVALSATGKGKDRQPNVEVIKVRDLFEDWDIQALSDPQIEELAQKAYAIGSSVDEIPTEEELRELVAELTK